MVKIKYSGGTNNKFASASLGGEMSSEEIPNGQLGNLFDNITRVEIINGRTEFRCFYIENDEGNDFFRARLQNLVVPVDAEISFAVDVSDPPQLLATEDQIPVGLTFYKFTEWNELEIPIGDLKDTKKVAIWLKRMVLEGSDEDKMIDFVIDAKDQNITITQDFGTIDNIFDNHFVTTRTPQFFTDQDFVGESLLS